MIYTPNYFTDCPGAIPQIVLSSCLLQAGNERAARYKNQLSVDNSKTTTFQFDGNFLNIIGLLPLAESRYLLSQPSLINRIGAINSENASMFGDIVGLPVNGFLPRPTQQSVTLPTGITSLSIAPFVVEKRLAYLVLLQQKRNRLIQLYNFLHYINLSSIFSDAVNVATPVQGTITSGYSYVEGNSVVSVGAVIGTIGYIYSYSVGPISRSISVVGICLSTMIRTYPDLKGLITDILSLEQWSEWVATELQKNDPISIPPIDFDTLVESVSDRVLEIRTQPTPRFPLGYVPNESGSDVDSTISGESRAGIDASVDQPSSFGEGAFEDSVFNDSSNSNGSLGSSPKQDYEPETPDRPDNTLPPC